MCHTYSHWCNKCRELLLSYCLWLCKNIFIQVLYIAPPRILQWYLNSSAKLQWSTNYSCDCFTTWWSLKLKQWSTKICLKDDFSTQLVITQTETIINKICLWGGFTTLSTRWNYQQMHGIFEMTLPHIWWSPWPWIGDGIRIETILPHTWWIGDH